ncbi:SGNH/GDSL hydrolase family protein [Nocardioides sp. SYSU D00038]|uniref:SGNH/GDSL hydrolase family protein n=1 Tax=Nocardioides sp. SYSU D00038 TaxID=2812554 RepID=UPI0019672B2A|nr:SGNH/GDSL hydrolase family protein [Nocardioides sp. SYSU D00038]
MFDADLVRGALELERTEHGLRPHRLPAWARAQTHDPQLHLVEAQPSGVRVAMHTDATSFELDVLATKRRYAGAPVPPDGSYDVVADGVVVGQLHAEGGNILHVDMMTGEGTLEPGEPTTLAFTVPAGSRTVEVWLPHDEQTVLVDLRADGAVRPVTDERPVWLHHGSSISHGSAATRPTGTWPAVAARLADVALVNLGLGGSALLDPFVARTIRDQPADLISLKLGINVVNQDLMRRRALRPAVHGFLDTIRDGHPETPLLLVSPILCPVHEDVPGPTAPDLEALGDGRLAFVAAGDPAEVAQGRLTLTAIREVLAGVVAERDDPHLSYLDGRELYGEGDTGRLPLPDNLHPDPATHLLIGERFARLDWWGRAGRRG